MANQDSSKKLCRQSLRLDAATWEAIDKMRLTRPGKVSRNTWIIEAVQERLARLHAAQDEERRDV